MEGARPRQRLGTGPVTGPLERPSQRAPENRKAAEQARPARDPIRAARRAVGSIHTAEQQLLSAAQREERDRAVRAIDAGLAGRHAGNVAAVVARFADRRAALAMMTDPNVRAAAAQRLAAEEAHELARLALEHAAEKRRLRNSVLASMGVLHRSARRALCQRLRRQRVGIAVQLQALRPRLGAAGSSQRISIARNSTGFLSGWRHC